MLKLLDQKMLESEYKTFKIWRGGDCPTIPYITLAILIWIHSLLNLQHGLFML